MRKRILAYIKYMEELLLKLEGNRGNGENGNAMDGEWANGTGTVTGEMDLERIKKEHLTQIAFFAHERLIHLIVTVLFAVLEFLSLLMCMLFPGIGTVLLTFAVLVLLVPYIRHYYLLENEVQHMYEQYDRLQSLIDGKSFKM